MILPEYTQEEILEYCEEKCGRTVVKLWMRPLEMISADGNKVVYKSVSQVQKKVIENAYLQILIEAYKAVLDVEVEIEIVLDEPVSDEEAEPVSEEESSEEEENENPEETEEADDSKDQPEPEEKAPEQENDEVEKIDRLAQLRSARINERLASRRRPDMSERIRERRTEPLGETPEKKENVGRVIKGGAADKKEPLQRKPEARGARSSEKPAADKKVIALIAIIIEDGSASDRVESVLTRYSMVIAGRMSIPYQEKDYTAVSVAVKSEPDVVGSITAKLEKINGVTVKSVMPGKREM